MTMGMMPTEYMGALIAAFQRRFCSSVSVMGACRVTVPSGSMMPSGLRTGRSLLLDFTTQVWHRL